jgi:hypothetical protein
MTVLTIAADEDAPVRLRSAVATFPHSFRTTGPATALVHIVGGDPGWTERARSLIQKGARAVLVGDPVAEDPGALRAGAEDAGASVLLAPAGADDPGIAQTRERLAAADGKLLECRLVASPSTSRSATVVAMLGVVSNVDSPLQELDTTWGDENGFHATGRLESGRDVVLALDASDAVRPVARVRLISSAGVVEADIPMTERSRPALVRDISALGEWHAESAYVSSSRAVLARLHATATGTHDVSDLEQFERRLPVARRLPWL